jgi:hypothetical protein
MPLQYPPQSPYNPYTEPKRPANIPKILLICFAIIVLFVAGLFLYIYSKGTNNNNDGVLPNNNGITVGEPNPNGYDCSSDVYNCANFTTKSQAQVVYDFCVSEGKGDIHRLDADGNGKACESLE